MCGELKFGENMYTDKGHHVRLKCIRGTVDYDKSKFVRIEEYERVKADCDKWYRLWLEECKKRKFYKV